MFTDLHSSGQRHARVDTRLARVIYIGTAMIPAYGPLRAARFMHARGVPPCVLVAVLRLGDRRRNDSAMRRTPLPVHLPLPVPCRAPAPAPAPEQETT